MGEDIESFTVGDGTEAIDDLRFRIDECGFSIPKSSIRNRTA